MNKTIYKMYTNFIEYSNSKITTWDTIAEKNRMRESYRRYHLNHTLEGMDDVYIQLSRVEEAFQDYLKELDRCSPNFLV